MHSQHNKLRELWTDFVSVWRNEVHEMMHDAGVLIFFVLLPLAYPLLYYYVYSTEVARDVPVAVVDECRSAHSRLFLRRIDASPELSIAAHCPDMAQAQHLMERGDVFGIVRIPSTFEADIQHGQQTRVAAYADVSSMIYYKNVLLPCSNVSILMNRELRADVLAVGLTDRQVEVLKAPIDYQHVQLFNPQGGYASFLIPPILMLILQQAMVIGMGIAMGRTREKNGGAVTYLGLRGYDQPALVVLAKVAAVAPIFTIMGLYMLLGVTYGFSLPSLAHQGHWVSFLVPYVLACSCFSIVCSFLIFRREDSMLLFVFMSIPLLFMSGVSWPGASIPAIWEAVSCLFPSTFGLNAHVRLASMGGTIAHVRSELLWLWGQTAFYFVVAVALHIWLARKPRPAKPSRADERLRRGME